MHTVRNHGIERKPRATTGCGPEGFEHAGDILGRLGRQHDAKVIWIGAALIGLLAHHGAQEDDRFDLSSLIGTALRIGDELMAATEGEQL